jgi:hypothetical protein
MGLHFSEGNYNLPTCIQIAPYKLSFNLIVKIACFFMVGVMHVSCRNYKGETLISQLSYKPWLTPCCFFPGVFLPIKCTVCVQGEISGMWFCILCFLLTVKTITAPRLVLHWFPVKATPSHHWNSIHAHLGGLICKAVCGSVCCVCRPWVHLDLGLMLDVLWGHAPYCWFFRVWKVLTCV